MLFTLPYSPGSDTPGSENNTSHLRELRARCGGDNKLVNAKSAAVAYEEAEECTQLTLQSDKLLDIWPKLNSKTWKLISKIHTKTQIIKLTFI